MQLSRAPRKSVGRKVSCKCLGKKVKESLQETSREASWKSVGRTRKISIPKTSKEAPRKSVGRTRKISIPKTSKQAPQKSAGRSRKTSLLKTSEKPLREAARKSAGRPRKLSLQKTLENSSRKAPRKSAGRPTKTSLLKTSEKSSREAPRKSAVRPRKLTLQKTLEKPSREARRKSVARPKKFSLQKTLEKPSIAAARKSVGRTKTLPSKSSGKQSRDLSQKTLEKPSRKPMLKNVAKTSTKSSQSVNMASSKVSRKTLESNKKAVVLASKKNLGSYSKTVVCGESKFCTFCKRDFTSKKLLKEHYIKHHFFRHCPNCPKTFQQTRKFILHLRSHLEDHPYECKICLVSFNKKAALCTHKNRHKPGFKFFCDVCHEVYPHPASLNRHRLTHYGPPYSCDDCGATFSNVPDLIVHSKNHVHRCILCPQKVVAFPTNVDLASHMYRVHRNKEFDPNEPMDTYEPCVSTGAVKLEDDGASDSMDDSISSDDAESAADMDSNYQRDAVESVYSLKRKDKFICFICYDLYPSSKLLKSHMKAHNWYPCNSCPQFFADDKKLKAHECYFVEAPSFKCSICNCKTDCENCKKSEFLNISTVSMDESESIESKFPETPSLGITNYADVAERNHLINFIEYVKSYKGPLDIVNFTYIGYHYANLKILLKNPQVKRLFHEESIPAIEELYSKFQNLNQILLDRMNRSSKQ